MSRQLSANGMALITKDLLNAGARVDISPIGVDCLFFMVDLKKIANIQQRF
jgi:hypothetical protein